MEAPIPNKYLCEAKKFLEKSISVYQQGISVAEANGDKQVAKEMAVFLRRLTKK